MKKRAYITKMEREKCRKVVDAYTKLFEEEEDAIVLDAGRYGFVELRYYKPGRGFDIVETFTDSGKLFDALWGEWLNLQLFAVAKGKRMEEIDYGEIFRSLSNEEQGRLLNMRHYFEEKAKGCGHSVSKEI